MTVRNLQRKQLPKQSTMKSLPMKAMPLFLHRRQNHRRQKKTIQIRRRLLKRIRQTIRLLPGQKRSGRAPGIPVLTQLPVPIQVPIPKSLRARPPVHGLIPTISRTLLKLRQEKTRLRISRVETALFSFVSPRMRQPTMYFTPLPTAIPTPNYMIPVCRSYTQVIMTTVRILKSTILLTKETPTISKSVHGTPISLLSKYISGRYISPVNL